jgi:hypothetical protein
MLLSVQILEKHLRLVPIEDDDWSGEGTNLQHLS